MTAVVTKTVAELIDDIRTSADVLNTTATGMTDVRILSIANSIAQEMHDLILSVDNSYYIQGYTFSLPDAVLQTLYTAQNLGDAPANWSACPDGYYKDVGLDLSPALPTPITCHNFNFAERNSPARRTWHTYRPVGRAAGVQVLEHLCGNSAAATSGDYKLWFVGRAPVLAKATFIDATSGINAVDGILKSWSFANASFTDADVGTYLVVSGATQAANNGTFLITSVTSATDVVTSLAAVVDEAFPTTVVASYQPGGTVGRLDDIQQIWNWYIRAGSAMVILGIQEDDEGPLARQKAEQRQRILNMAANRTSEPECAPVVETFGGNYYGSDYGDEPGNI